MKRGLCKNCVGQARNHRRIPAFTKSYQAATCDGMPLQRLCNELFRCRSVLVAELAFQACAFNYSAISPV